MLKFSRKNLYLDELQGASFELQVKEFYAAVHMKKFIYEVQVQFSI